MAAIDYFLKLDGISGESKDSKHKGEIEVLSFSFVETQSGSPGVGGGGGAGKVHMSDFTFTARTSKASPQLFMHCAQGKHIKQAFLTARKAGGSQQEYLKIKLNDVLVSSYAFGGGEEKIKVRGSDDVLVFRAKCCNPIRGEKIVGYITRGKGVSVHSATCPNVVNLLYDPERKIEVEWDKTSGAEAAAPYTVKLTMEVEDRKGVLAAVSAKIADINTNIKDLEARTGDENQHARIDVTVEISDVQHLDRVIKSLKTVNGVLDVERAGRAG